MDDVKKIHSKLRRMIAEYIRQALEWKAQWGYADSVFLMRRTRTCTAIGIAHIVGAINTRTYNRLMAFNDSLSKGGGK
jgi:hypothetical protein